MSDTMNHSFALTTSTHQALKDHLFPGDGLESVAILLCHRSEGINGFRLMVKEWVPIMARECGKRTATCISWPFADYMDAKRIEQIDVDRLCVFTIHSHPSGCDRFSSIDDDNDKPLLASVCAWFDDGRPNGSAIMLSDGRLIARTCDTNGVFTAIESVCVVGEDIQIWKQGKAASQTPGSAMRIEQTFGKGTINLLRQLKVGVVGCSGTGSVIVELLARNCIGTLVLVDPDVVEEKNLNRIVNAGKVDAHEAVPKVEVLKQAVESMGTGVTVEAYCADTYGDNVLEALTGCDILFGCVDSATGRYHLDCVASACLIPYFDVGVYLSADGCGGIADADAVAHYMHPEGASLLDRGGYTSKMLSAEGLKRTDEASYEKQRDEGYLEGIAEDKPAVISVNMQAACLAFNDFLARIHNFRLDKNADFATQRISLVKGCYTNESNRQIVGSIFQKHVGMGDESHLLRNIKRARRQ